jgi:hypothetical protein
LFSGQPFGKPIKTKRSLLVFIPLFPVFSGQPFGKPIKTLRRVCHRFHSLPLAGFSGQPFGKPIKTRYSIYISGEIPLFSGQPFGKPIKTDA